MHIHNHRDLWNVLRKIIFTNHTWNPFKSNCEREPSKFWRHYIMLKSQIMHVRKKTCFGPGVSGLIDGRYLHTQWYVTPCYRALLHFFGVIVQLCPLWFADHHVPACMGGNTLNPSSLQRAKSRRVPIGRSLGRHESIAISLSQIYIVLRNASRK